MIPYDRWSFLVKSETRGDVTHLVDLEGDGNEPVVCTCESFIMGHARPCKHIKKIAGDLWK